MENYKHSVSKLLIDLTNRFERGLVSKEQVLAVVTALEAISVDERQSAFFKAFRALLDKVELALLGFDTAE